MYGGWGCGWIFVSVELHDGSLSENVRWRTCVGREKRCGRGRASSKSALRSCKYVVDESTDQEHDPTPCCVLRLETRFRRPYPTMARRKMLSIHNIGLSNLPLVLSAFISRRFRALTGQFYVVTVIPPCDRRNIVPLCFLFPKRFSAPSLAASSKD